MPAPIPELSRPTADVRNPDPDLLIYLSICLSDWRRPYQNWVGLPPTYNTQIQPMYMSVCLSGGDHTRTEYCWHVISISVCVCLSKQNEGARQSLSGCWGNVLIHGSPANTRDHKNSSLHLTAHRLVSLDSCFRSYVWNGHAVSPSYNHHTADHTQTSDNKLHTQYEDNIRQRTWPSRVTSLVPEPKPDTGETVI